MLEELIVIVLDVGESMKIKTEGSISLEEAKKCIKMIIQRKIFSESEDQIALILVGDERKMEEDPDDDCASDKRYINVIQGLQLANFKLYQFVDDIECTNLPINFLSGLDAAIDLFHSTKGVTQFCSKRILYLSECGAGQLDPIRTNVICDKLKESNIQFNIIASTAFNKRLTKADYPKGFEPESKFELCIIDLLKQVNGESYSYSDVLKSLTYYQMKKVKPSPGYLNFEIGTLKIPINMHIKVTESKPKSWSSACAHAEEVKIKRTTTYCMNDETQTRVNPDDIMPAYKYGTTLVPFSEEDKKNMEYQSGGKDMKLLGFTKKSNIERHLYVGNSSKYVTSNTNQTGKEVLAAFTQGLSRTNMVAIVRLVPSPTSNPVIGFLSPKITQRHQHLVFVTLPYMEDIRHYVFTSLDSDSKNIPSEEELNAIDDLISDMDLTKINDEEDDEILKPKNTVNPYVQRLFHCLQTRALHPEKPLPPIQPHILDLINPDPKVLKRAEASLKRVQSLFPIKELTPKNPSGTISDLFPPMEPIQPLVQILKNEGASETKFNVTEANLIDAMTDKITEIGSINPVRDIQHLADQQLMPFDKMCEKIEDIINILLADSPYVHCYHPKVLSVLKEFRSRSFKEASCEKFNLLMLSLPERLLGGKNEELLDKIKNEKLGLISNLELSSSSISPKEAEMYLSQTGYEKRAKDFELSLSCFDDDDDDLMDQL